MDEQQLIDRLEERVADVPVGVVPIDAMRTTARRRRGRLAVLAAAAAVAVISAGAVAWQTIDTDPATPVATDPPADPDAPPAGHRYVGIGSAVIAVPEDWGTNETECGTPVEDTVMIDVGMTCLALIPRPADVESVEVRPLYPEENVAGWTEDEIDGEQALWSPVLVDRGIASGSIYLPKQGVVFVAQSSSAQPKAVVSDLLAGVTILEEHFTVPGYQHLAYDEDPASAVETYTEGLRQLGLAVGVVEEASELESGTVIATEPAVGSVVAPGDTVRVTVAR